MKDLEPQLDAILEKNIGIMKERAGQSVDLDLFFNMLSSGTYFLQSLGSALTCARLLFYGNLFQSQELD